MEQAVKFTVPSYYCQLHTTRKEILDSVCLGEECANSGPLCRKCCIGKHANHNTLTIVQLMEDIESLRFDKTLTNAAENIVQTSKDIKVKWLAATAELRQQINNNLSKLESRIAGFEQ